MNNKCLRHWRLNYRCALLVLLMLGCQATCFAVDVTFTVSANTDDADEISSGTVYVTDGSSYFASTRMGFRFQNVNIPADATITSATLEVFSNGNGTSSFSVDILAQDADNPDTFSTTAYDITSRPITTAQTLWSPGSASYTVGQSIVSPNFASSIQEVIDRSGWASGNSLVVMTTANSGDRGIFKRSGSTTYAPQLHISYTVPTDYYVRPDGSDSNSGTGSDAANAWASVVHAATQSLSPGDTVYVMAGSYVGEPDPTVDGTSGNPIRFVADRDGAIFGTAGDVTLVAPASSEVLDLNWANYLEFVGFRFQGGGAGQETIAIDDAIDVLFDQCEIFDGVYDGVDIENSSITFRNCLIYNNDDHGIDARSNSTVTVVNCTIVNNGADGVLVSSGTTTVQNSILANNSDDGLDRNGGTLTSSYNLVHGNSSANYEGTSGGTGDVSSDPLFVSSTDFTLLPGSPALDAGTSLSGTVDTDFNGTARPIGSGWDMGCYEGASGGLVGHWKLDENSGTTAADSSGNSGDGTINGTPSWTSAIYGNGHDFNYADGDDYVEIPNSSSLENVQEGNYTLAAWFRPDTVPPGSGADNTASYALVIKAGNHTGLTYTNSGEFMMDHWLSGPTNANAVTTGTSYPAGQYYHVAAAVNKDAGTIKLYVNGELVQTSNFTAGSSAHEYGTEPWRIGIASPGASNWRWSADGVIDDVRIYVTALTDAEVAALYDLQGHWRLDENSGTLADDSSPQQRDGTYTNGPTLGVEGPYPGDVLTSVDFDGSDDHVDIADIDTDFSYGMTAAFWFYPESVPTIEYGMLSISNGQDVDDIWIGWLPGTGMELYFSDPTNGSLYTWLDDNLDPEINKWHHFVATVDASGNAKIYRNGEEVASGFVSLPGNVLRTLNTIGDSVWNDPFPGKMDDVRFYNRPLSAEEVSELYGLVGHWKMDEGSGSTAADSSGYANDAALSGATWTSDCVGNIGLEFDGLGDTAATASDFDPPATGTVSFWMRGSGTPTARERLFGNGGNWEARQETTGIVVFDLGASSSVGNQPFSTTDAVDFQDRWYHVVASYNDVDDSYEVYIDGTLLASGTSPVDLVDQAAAILSFGTRTGNTEYWQGALRDFRVYNRWLSDTEITDLSGLVAYWKLDELSGTVAADASPNAHDGTLVGSPVWTTAGQVDGALEFETSDGDDRVDVGTFDVSGSELSIAAWVHPEDGGTDQRIVMKADSLTLSDQYWGMTVDLSLGLDFRVKAGGTTDLFTASNVLSPGKWYHVAGTYDGTTMRMYVNGSEINNVAHSVGGALDQDATVPVTLGAANISGREYDGRLDDVRVLSRVMCPEEIRGIYRGSRPTGVRIIRWVEVR